MSTLPGAILTNFIYAAIGGLMVVGMFIGIGLVIGMGLN
jgi:hypothetical protein